MRGGTVDTWWMTCERHIAKERRLKEGRKMRKERKKEEKRARRKIMDSPRKERKSEDGKKTL